jgi:hypothetical protein
MKNCVYTRRSAFGVTYRLAYVLSGIALGGGESGFRAAITGAVRLDHTFAVR